MAMTGSANFDQLISRKGTWCTQWDYVADRFGVADLLPFTISDMDFQAPPTVLAALHQKIDHGIFGYTRWKNPAYLEAISHWYQSQFAYTIDPEQIVYAPSVLYGIATLIRLWSEPGDGVMVHLPAYDAFFGLLSANQRQLVPITLQKQGDIWRFNLEAFEALCAKKQNKILLLCSPHNPTGTVWPKATLSAMAEITQRHGVAVITDEIHMDLLWKGARHTPWLAVASPDETAAPWALWTAASKTFNLSALMGAYGFIANPAERARYLTQLKAADGLSPAPICSLVAQIAAYQTGGEWLHELRAYIEGNFSYFTQRVTEALPLHYAPPEATYFAWLNVEPLKLAPTALQEALITQGRLAVLPGTTYGPQGAGFLRFNLAAPRQKIEQGVDGFLYAVTQCARSKSTPRT